MRPRQRIRTEYASSAAPFEKEQERAGRGCAVGLVSGERRCSGLRRANRSGAAARRVPPGLPAGSACGTYQRQGVGRSRRRAWGVPVSRLGGAEWSSSWTQRSLCQFCGKAGRRGALRRHCRRLAAMTLAEEIALELGGCRRRGTWPISRAAVCSSWAVRGKRAARSAAWTRRRTRGRRVGEAAHPGPATLSTMRRSRSVPASRMRASDTVVDANSQSGVARTL